MSEFCDFRVEDGITIARFTKLPDLGAIKSVMEELVANYPSERRLWDMRDIVINQTQEELRAVSKQASNTFSKPSRSAFVASDDLTFGVLRIFEVFSEQQNSPSRIRIFRSMDDAKAWLLEKLPD